MPALTLNNSGVEGLCLATFVSVYAENARIFPVTSTMMGKPS